MIKTLKIAFGLLWNACDTLKLRMQLIANYSVALVQGVTDFFAPLFLSWVILDLTQKNILSALRNFYWMCGCYALLVLGRFLWRRYIENIGKVLPLKTKLIYYQKIFNKPYDWHLHNSVGYFATALDHVCTNLGSFCWKMPYDYLGNLLILIFFLIYSTNISIYLGAYFLASITLMVLIIRVLYEKRLKYIRSFSQANLSFNKSFIDYIYNIRTVKKMNLLNFVEKNNSQKVDQAVECSSQMYRYNALQWGFMELVIHTIFILPLGFYIYEFIKTGQGIEIIVMIVGIQDKIVRFGRLLMSLMHELATTQTEYRILAEHLGKNIPTPTTNEKAPKKWRNIVFDNTRFEFSKDGNIFCHQVPYFEIKPGDHIAITGKSGNGKTTFLNLLTRQFDANSGHIYLDGKDVTKLSLAFFDNNVTYISQDVELFDMTFYDNIVMGKQVSKAKLKKIINGCCLNDLIARMNGNMHTDIGEKGIKVSAGEKQRINLARGLLLDRNILVLDEITANLDPLTTQHIWKFIFEEYNDKTIIAVSHEPELLKHINRRLEFQNGRAQEIIVKSEAQAV